MSRFSRLRMENFKPFGASQDIPLAPITCVFGPNSVGKSSLLEALLMLSQTMDRPGVEPPVSFRGPFVNVGDYRSAVHRHDVALPLVLGLFATMDGMELMNSEVQQVLHNSVPEVGLVWRFGFEQLEDKTLHLATDIFVAESDVPLFRIVVNEPRNIKKPHIVSASQTVSREGLPDFDIEYEEYDEWIHKTFLDLTVPRAWVDHYRRGARHVSAERFWRAVLHKAIERWEPMATMLQVPLQEIAQNPSLAFKRLDKWLFTTEKDLTIWDVVDDENWPIEKELAAWHEEIRATLNEWVNAFKDENIDRQLGRWSEWLRTIRYGGMGDPIEFAGTPSSHFSWELSGPEDDWLVLQYPSGGFHEYIHQIVRHRRREAEEQRPGKKFQPTTPGTLLSPPEYVNAFQETMRVLLSRVYFLGPARVRPGMVVARAEHAVKDVGVRGEQTADVLGQNLTLLQRVNDWLKRMQVDYRISVEAVADPELPGYLKMVLEDQSLGTRVSLDQLGYGVSQVLPIIVDALSESAHTLVLQQPELHLHPRLQAELGSLFAEGISVGNQFIIETHSEHLILRLQRLVRTGHLKPDDVAVLYIVKTGDGSQVRRLRMDEDGEFKDPWPGGFFEESYYEMFGNEVD